jgi:hypothetical protein
MLFGPDLGVPRAGEVTRCWGNIRSWAQSAHDAAGLQRVRWGDIYAPYEREQADFAAHIGAADFDTTLRPPFFPLADVLASGFNGYFEVEWIGTAPAHRVVLVNGSQYQSYSENPATHPAISGSFCRRDPDGSGTCFADFAYFEQHASPNAFAQFSMAIAETCIRLACSLTTAYRFEARIGNEHYSCVPVDTRIKDFWPHALKHDTHFTIDWDAAGNCTMLGLVHGSFHYPYRAVH